MDDVNMYSSRPVMNGINGGVNNSLGRSKNNPTGSNSYRRKGFLQGLIGVITCSMCSLFLEKKIFCFFLFFLLLSLFFYYSQNVIYKRPIGNR